MPPPPIRPDRARYAALLASAAILVASTSRAYAGQVQIHDVDGAGQGLNDATPATPVGGNKGTTLGQQRLNVLQQAAATWSQLLGITVDVVVDASFTPLTCTNTSGILGHGGATQVFFNFGAGSADTWYPVALANNLAGQDLNGSMSEISLSMNSNVGQSGCLGGEQFYLGLDGAPPSGQVDLLSVSLHEIGHGLGFFTVVDLSSGAKLSGLDDVYMTHLLDNTLGLAWPKLSDAQRAASATNNGNLHWVGTNIAGASTILTSGRTAQGHVLMYAPTHLSAGSSVSHFDTTLVPAQLLAPIYTGPTGPGLTPYVFADIGWQLRICGNGVLDPGEQCDDGNTANGDCCSSTCTFEAAGSACGDHSSAACDKPDACDGKGACQVNRVAAGTTCRAAAGPCDVAETCDGKSTTCPADAKAGAGTTCRAAAGPCDVAETCDGKNVTCPADVLAASGVTCRAVAGACDVAEKCSGKAVTCPADAKVAAGTVCRPVAGPCDVAEACDGTNAACPADGFVAAGKVCRASTGVCDVAESCTGASAACPADGFASAGTMCRSSAGACDPAETCSGVGAACPADARAARGTVCRPSVGVCDQPETCDGASVTCPADLAAANGTPCSDGVVCNGSETCQSGHCSPGQPLSCSPGNACIMVACGEPGGCAATPIAGCCLTSADCNDGNACTTDTCAGPGLGCTFAPVAGCCNSDRDCDDKNDCTADRCSGPGGTCSHSAISGCCLNDQACDDGNSCTVDHCDTAQRRCVSTPQAGCCSSDRMCDDGNACTTDHCDLKTGTCANAAIAGCCLTDGDCDDGNACTLDHCSGPGGTCSATPIAGCCRADLDCDDGDLCTVDRCDPSTGRCVARPISGCCHADVDCTMGKACSTEACDQAEHLCKPSMSIAGCCMVDSECDDMNGCTIDQCVNRACVATAIAGCGRDAAIAEGDDGGADAGSGADADLGDGAAPDGALAVDSGAPPGNLGGPGGSGGPRGVQARPHACACVAAYPGGAIPALVLAGLLAIALIGRRCGRGEGRADVSCGAGSSAPPAGGGPDR